MRSRRRVLSLLCFLLLTGLLVWATAPFWLSGIGHNLVSASVPAKADAIMVLAGDWGGRRILTACELLRKEMAPVILVNGPLEWYGINEADGAIRYAGEHGCDTSRLRAVYIHAFSTEEEARALHPKLREWGIRSVLIVTSNFHTARAARVFQRELRDDIRFTMAGAPDRFFTPDSWWKSREGQKTVFFEYSKTIAYWVGL